MKAASMRLLLECNEDISACDLCGSDKLTAKHNNVARCQGCGYVFANPRPSQEAIARSYGESHSYDYWLQDDRIRREIYGTGRLGLVMKYKATGRILDVGAGPGLFLSVAEEEGFDVYGTEMSTLAIRTAETRFGLQLFCGQLEDAGFPDSFFDVVTLWHVFEHVPSPSNVMSEVRRILRNNGILVIEVPNDNFFRWEQIKRVLKNQVKYLLNMLPNRNFQIQKRYTPFRLGGEVHLSYFTPKMLRMILESNQFCVKEQSIGYRAKPTRAIRLARGINLDINRLTRHNLASTCLIIGRKV